jgi:hypothetical protein
MSRAKARQDMLSRVVAVRGVQRRAAELRLEAAAETLRRREEAETEARRRLADEEGEWSAAMGRRLDPQLASCWAAAIGESEALLHAASAEAEAAAGEREARSSDWRRALAAEEVSETLFKSAARKARLRREEDALNALAERPRSKGTRQ